VLGRTQAIELWADCHFQNALLSFGPIGRGSGPKRNRGLLRPCEVADDCRADDDLFGAGRERSTRQAGEVFVEPDLGVASMSGSGNFGVASQASVRVVAPRASWEP